MIAAIWCGAVQAQTTAFTYQGRLNDGTNAATGTYDLSFTLYDTNSAGNIIAGPVTNLATAVNDGLFTTTVDFGPGVFTGPTYWLEVAVRTNTGTAFSVLSPREPVLPAPYAIEAGSALSVPATNITGTIANTQLSTNVAFLNGSANFSGIVTATNFNGNGAGLTNVPGTFTWQAVSGTNQQAAPNFGYVVTNNYILTNSQVIVTLPVSTNVGDVIRVTGMGGGWKIAQNTGQIVKSFAGEFTGYTAWTNHGVNAFWSSIAASANGAQLVAAAEDTIYISGDSGNTWIPSTNFTAGYYVACSSDGTKQVAVGNTGSIATSTNSGATWVTQVSPSVTWRGVASSADGTRLVAVPTSGTIYTSPDSGVDWISRNPSLTWSSVASSWDGSKLAAVGNSGIYTSTNFGTSWTFRTNIFTSVNSFNGPYLASSADGTKLVLAAANASNEEPIYTSSDSGATWQSQNIGSQGWTSVACSSDGTKLFAAEGVSGNKNRIYSSMDSGLTWLPLITTNQNWSSIAVSSNGAAITATVNNGFIYNSQFISKSATTVGTNGFLLGGSGTAIELQYTGNGQFIPISHEGNIEAY